VQPIRQVFLLQRCQMLELRRAVQDAVEAAELA